MFQGFDPFDTGINIESVSTQKANEGDSESFSNFNSQCARRGYGTEDRHASDKTFLQQLVTGASTHHQYLVVEWQLVIEQAPADQFIECVVAANILTGCEQVSGQVEEGCGVESNIGFRKILKLAKKSE